MGRRSQPEIRERLLEVCTDHALAEGLPAVLEPFVEATGVSKRVLLYHFGTRDGLLRAVLEKARERQLAAWGELLRAKPGVPYTTVLADAWTTISGPEGAPYVRIFDRLRRDDEQRLWPGFRRLATTDWLEPIAAGLGGREGPALATLVLAVFRGLLADLEATGDATRTREAFDRFLQDVLAPRVRQN